MVVIAARAGAETRATKAVDTQQRVRRTAASAVEQAQWEASGAVAAGGVAQDAARTVDEAAQIE